VAQPFLQAPRRVLLRLEYEGTDFHGWQRQPALRTVQGELERAIGRALGEAVEVEATSRTDQGVHAAGQAAAFSTGTAIPAARLPLVLNSVLPPDIRIREARDVAPNFRPRLAAAGKLYRYTFSCRQWESVFLRRFTSRVGRPLALGAMREAASELLGEHDFGSFQGASRLPPASSVRRLYLLRVHEEGPLVHLNVVGDGFLYRMVRTIAGTLLEVGLGRRPPSTLPQILAARDRRLAGPTAEARGLCLVKVYFSPGEWLQDPEAAGGACRS
jgi:tRNA pseudouridine38-40 synthase